MRQFEHLLRRHDVAAPWLQGRVGVGLVVALALALLALVLANLLLDVVTAELLGVPSAHTMPGPGAYCYNQAMVVGDLVLDDHLIRHCPCTALRVVLGYQVLARRGPLKPGHQLMFRHRMLAGSPGTCYEIKRLEFDNFK